ncbi:MAG: histidine kinase [Methylobacteriaceae bacterium]|nr:histidine kinase [Methylobacteriaceae bacterium]
MPSLIRFLVIVAILAGLVYGGMIALVTFVEPQPREMTQTLPASKLNK